MIAKAFVPTISKLILPTISLINNLQVPPNPGEFDPQHRLMPVQGSRPEGVWHDIEIYIYETYVLYVMWYDMPYVVVWNMMLYEMPYGVKCHDVVWNALMWYEYEMPRCGMKCHDMAWNAMIWYEMPRWDMKCNEVILSYNDVLWIIMKWYEIPGHVVTMQWYGIKWQCMIYHEITIWWNIGFL